MFPLVRHFPGPSPPPAQGRSAQCRAGGDGPVWAVPPLGRLQEADPLQFGSPIPDPEKTEEVKATDQSIISSASWPGPCNSQKTTSVAGLTNRFSVPWLSAGEALLPIE